MVLCNIQISGKQSSALRHIYQNEPKQELIWYMTSFFEQNDWNSEALFRFVEAHPDIGCAESLFACRGQECIREYLRCSRVAEEEAAALCSSLGERSFFPEKMADLEGECATHSVRQGQFLLLLPVKLRCFNAFS